MNAKAPASLQERYFDMMMNNRTNCPTCDRNVSVLELIFFGYIGEPKAGVDYTTRCDYCKNEVK